MIIITGNHHDRSSRPQDWLAALPLLSPHHWNITCWLSPLAIKIPIIIIVTIPRPSTHTGWHWRPRKKQKGQFLSTFVRSPQFSREKKCGLTLSPRFICFHNNSPFPCCFRPSLTVIGFYFLYTSTCWSFCGFGWTSLLSARLIIRVLFGFWFDFTNFTNLQIVIRQCCLGLGWGWMQISINL